MAQKWVVFQFLLWFLVSADLDTRSVLTSHPKRIQSLVQDTIMQKKKGKRWANKLCCCKPSSMSNAFVHLNRVCKSVDCMISYWLAMILILLYLSPSGTFSVSTCKLELFYVAGWTSWPQVHLNKNWGRWERLQHSKDFGKAWRTWQSKTLFLYTLVHSFHLRSAFKKLVVAFLNLNYFHLSGQKAS